MIKIRFMNLALPVLTALFILIANEATAKDAESAHAMFQTGYNLYGAQGVEQDCAKALELWEKAAEMGHGWAASAAAMAYLSGEGVEEDSAKGRQLAERAATLNNPYGLVLMGELHFQAGEMDEATRYWKAVAAMKPVKPTGQPTQPSGEMAAQQGADLLKLMDWRKREPIPGSFALIEIPHIYQGHNNCGATSCAMLAKHQGAATSGWGFKRLCPTPVGTGTDWDHLRKASDHFNLSWKLITFAADEAGFSEGEAFVRKQLDAGNPMVIDFKFYGEHYPNGEAGHTLTLVGYIAEEDIYILCNPAIASPGLNLMSREDLEKYWRSNYYSHLAERQMARPLLIQQN